jgi:hypothetical protein
MGKKKPASKLLIRVEKIKKRKYDHRVNQLYINDVSTRKRTLLSKTGTLEKKLEKYEQAYSVAFKRDEIKNFSKILIFC